LAENLISILASLFEGVPRPQSGFLIEAPNLGQDYYKKLFFGKDHTNYICEGRFLECKVCNDVSSILKLENSPNLTVTSLSVS